MSTTSCPFECTVELDAWNNQCLYCLSRPALLRIPADKLPELRQICLDQLSTHISIIRIKRFMKIIQYLVNQNLAVPFFRQPPTALLRGFDRQDAMDVLTRAFSEDPWNPALVAWTISFADRSILSWYHNTLHRVPNKLFRISDLEPFFMCSICSLEYSNRVLPTTLPCGHTICMTCGALMSECPLCRNDYFAYLLNKNVEHHQVVQTFHGIAINRVCRSVQYVLQLAPLLKHEQNLLSDAVLLHLNSDSVLQILLILLRHYLEKSDGEYLSLLKMTCHWHKQHVNDSMDVVPILRAVLDIKVTDTALIPALEQPLKLILDDRNVTLVGDILLRQCVWNGKTTST